MKNDEAFQAREELAAMRSHYNRMAMENQMMKSAAKAHTHPNVAFHGVQGVVNAWRGGSGSGGGGSPGIGGVPLSREEASAVPDRGEEGRRPARRPPPPRPGHGAAGASPSRKSLL